MKYILIVILSLLVFSSSALAAGLQDSTANLNIAAGQAGYDPSVTSPESIIAKVISTALSFLGVIFLILMIYGGFLWMTARGNDQQVDKAKNVIIAAVIGLIIVVSAYAITYFVVSELGGETLK